MPLINLVIAGHYHTNFGTTQSDISPNKLLDIIEDIIWASWFLTIPTSSHLIIRMPNKSTGMFLLNISINKEYRNYAANNTIRYLVTNIIIFSNYKITKFQRWQISYIIMKIKTYFVITSSPIINIGLIYSKQILFNYINSKEIFCKSKNFFRLQSCSKKLWSKEIIEKS